MIKITFCDFWPGFNIHDNFFTKLLTKYDKNIKIVNINDDFDVLVFSCFGNRTKTIPNTVRKIFFTGENIRPQHYSHNFALTFDRISSPTHFRLPLWLLYTNDLKIVKDYNEKRKNNIYETQLRKNFCCFVASKNIEFRNNFVKKLSQYKKIDCGGKCLNNIGGSLSLKDKQTSKINWQSQYKFCIAIENSKYPGYCTEKLLQAFSSGCIPIYIGDPTVEQDFDTRSFINANDFSNEEELIEYIKKVDNDDELYQSYFKHKIFSDYWNDILSNPENEDNFLKGILNNIIK